MSPWMSSHCVRGTENPRVVEPYPVVSTRYNLGRFRNPCPGRHVRTDIGPWWKVWSGTDRVKSERSVPDGIKIGQREGKLGKPLVDVPW